MKFASRSRTVAVFSAVVVALTLLCRAPAYPQAVGATLSGTVTDASGAAIPNVQITVKNSATGETQVVKTNSDGLYTAPNLLPGTYDVTFSAQGFALVTESNLVLAVGEQHSLNRTLQVGQATQKVEVTAAAATVELATSTVSGDVNSTAVRELPLNGRDWTALATLQSGVVPVRTQDSATSPNAPRSGRGFGNSLSTAGHRPNENNYRVNGISVLDYANASPGSVLGGALGVDGISEFTILTSNYSAEYGNTTGGVVNAITKSGTNSLHGDAFWFLREKSLDARNFFDNAIPPFHRNNFGGSLGGPIKKDKTFGFFDYEGMRQDKSISLHDFVPSLAARAGSLCSNPSGVTPACTPTNITVDPTVAKYLPLYPMPNAGTIGAGDVGVWTSSALQTFTENYYTARVDHKFSEKDSLAGSFFRDYGPFSQPDAMNDSINYSSVLRQMFSAEETHVFSPALVNTARGGYNRDVGLASYPLQALNPIANDKSLGAIPGVLRSPLLQVPGLTQMAGAFGDSSSSHYVFNSFQFYDDAFLTKGTHSLKFGFMWERQQFNGISFSRANGTFKFPSLEGFLLNQPQQDQSPVPGSPVEAGLRQSIYAGYLQDDWRARPNLTVNLGFRYEPVNLPTESKNMLQSISNAGFFTGGISQPIHTYWQSNPNLKDFEPRVGFSWDPFKDGKTAIRGGFGIFDDLPLPWLYGGGSTFTSYPFIRLIIIGDLPAGSFPTGVGPLLTSAVYDPAKSQNRYVQQNPPLNYGMNWNFNIQRQITPSVTAMVGYIGSRTLHQPGTPDDSDMVLPTLTSAGYLWPFPVGSGTEFDPNVGTIRATTWGGTASYEALTAQFTKKFSHGVQAQVGYNWSKCLDDGSGGTYGDMFGNSPASLLWIDEASKKGLCDFNIGHNFVANYVWEVPTPKFAGSGAGKTLLGGWEVTGIFTAGTGQPFPVLIGGDPVGMKGDPWPFPDRLAGCNAINSNFKADNMNYLNLNCFQPPTVPASFPNYATSCQPAAASVAASIPFTCMNLNGNAGRNEISGPGLANFDFSLIKNTYIRRISENFNIQFRAEVFNLFNRANFLPPDDQLTVLNVDGTQVSGGGAIDATSNDSREFQFGLKIIW